MWKAKDLRMNIQVPRPTRLASPRQRESVGFWTQIRGYQSIPVIQQSRTMDDDARQTMDLWGRVW